MENVKCRKNRNDHVLLSIKLKLMVVALLANLPVPTLSLQRSLHVRLSK